MGGIGSGRNKSSHAKLLTTDLHRISPKEIPFQWGQNFYVDGDTGKGHIHIDYRQIDDDTGDLRLVLGSLIQGRCGIQWTPMNFGNRRAWFECWFCESRVGHLYAYGVAMKCRKCLDMAYKSQRLSKTGRSSINQHRNG